MRWILPLLAIALAGCSGSGKLVAKPSPGAPAGTAPVVDALEPIGTAPASDAATNPAKAPIEIALAFEKGRKETYVLTNQTTTQTRASEKAPVVTTESFLDAKQDVTVMQTGEVRIHTYNARGAVYGEDPVEKKADEVIKQFAESVEGSMLQGTFDKRGRGDNLFLLGDGVGLNPMGPQAGAQEVMVGFMGVLLPGKSAKIGDKWTGTYDITASAIDLFEQQGAMVDGGEVTLTYELLDYDKERNAVVIGITSKGKPTVKIPMGSTVGKIVMDVQGHGQALVRMNDGWLQELRFESSIVTEGLVATKQVVKTIVRRQS